MSTSAMRCTFSSSIPMRLVVDNRGARPAEGELEVAERLHGPDAEQRDPKLLGQRQRLRRVGAARRLAPFPGLQPRHPGQRGGELDLLPRLARESDRLVRVTARPPSTGRWSPGRGRRGCRSWGSEITPTAVLARRVPRTPARSGHVRSAPRVGRARPTVAKTTSRGSSKSSSNPSKSAIARRDGGCPGPRPGQQPPAPGLPATSRPATVARCDSGFPAPALRLARPAADTIARVAPA